MALPASDNFDRANANPIGGNWTPVNPGNIQLLSNSVQSASAGDAAAYWNADVFDANQYSECKITGGADGGPAVRVTTNSCYYWTPASDGEIWKYVAPGSWSKIGECNFTITSSDVVRIEATGTTTTSLKVYKNGAQQGTTLTDSSSPLTSGSAGVYSVGATTLDDWAGGTPVTTTSTQLATRARNDDGSESAATTIADGNFTAPLDTNVRIRVQIDTSGDAASTAYRLEAQKSGDQVWAAVT